MNVYKLDVKKQGYWALDKDDYEQRTARRSPWYKVSDSGSPRYFAVCPACNNPIQIIGFYRLPANVSAPYAKHYNTALPGVGFYDREAYEHCPYADKTKSSGSDKGKRSPGALSRQILQLLIEHFDKVIWLLSKTIGIRIDEKLAVSMLRQYAREEGWLYSRATLMNIPWIFAYMADWQDIFYKKMENKEMAEALINAEPRRLSLNENGYLVKAPACTEFLTVGAYYTCHTASVTNDILSETMDLVVTIRCGYENPREIYRREIDFDFNYFNNIVNFSEWNSSAAGQRLLKHAAEILGPHLLNQ
ncbi:hypothetical protein [Pantoea sp. WEP]|uniref:hypothetical protein n=1 Tax=Pantoea sp. WEP TaxID=3230025 RepID=UPI0035642198